MVKFPEVKFTSRHNSHRFQRLFENALKVASISSTLAFYQNIPHCCGYVQAELFGTKNYDPGHSQGKYPFLLYLGAGIFFSVLNVIYVFALFFETPSLFSSNYFQGDPWFPFYAIKAIFESIVLSVLFPMATSSLRDLALCIVTICTFPMSIYNQYKYFKVNRSNTELSEKQRNCAMCSSCWIALAVFLQFCLALSILLGDYKPVEFYFSEGTWQVIYNSDQNFNPQDFNCSATHAVLTSSYYSGETSFGTGRINEFCTSKTDTGLSRMQCCCEYFPN